ncbi:MAG: hypothetical protein GTN76_01315 [Candidatus Aenigmarchaeota archaeon]|nr:hypothetical protein [Candidatus Aenigmarchaeota archaeon]
MKDITYGSKSYKFVDYLQRVGDFFRSIPGGRYKIVEDSDNVENGYLVKTNFLPFSKTHKPLKKKDFRGKIFRKKDNQRLVRFMDNYLRKIQKNGLSKPKNLSLYITGEKKTGYDPIETMFTADKFFTRKNYVKPYAKKETTVPEKKKLDKYLRKAAKVGVPILATIGLALKFFARDTQGFYIGDDIPFEVAKYNFDNFGTAFLGTSVGLALAGVLSSVSDVNLERYRKMRKEMKNEKGRKIVDIDFVGETSNSEYKASLIKTKCGGSDAIISQEHSDTLKPIVAPGSEKWKILKTYTGRDLEKVKNRVRKKGEKLSGPVFFSNI